MAADRYFFCHLQKTGGTALWRRLQHQFGAAGVYPGPDDGEPPASTTRLSNLHEVWARRGDEIQVVCGHFPLCTTELLGGGFRTFTLLRDPVDRVVSNLRHRRDLEGHPEQDLAELYDPLYVALLLRNHMTRMLSVRPDELDDEAMLSQIDVDLDRLDDAVAALDAMEVVGFQDDFDGFIGALEHQFGWDLGPALRMNTSTGPREPIDDDLRLRIEADNEFDLALYARARAGAGEPTPT